MADQTFTIELGDDLRAVVDPDDAAWLRGAIRREPGATRVQLRYDADEVEGHRAGSSLRVRVIADGEDDTEAHALSLHFPTTAQADAFRKRLMLTGVVVGAVTIGAVTGAGLASMQVDAPSASLSGASATDVNRDVGLMDFGAAAGAAAAPAAAAASDANRDVGLMDFSSAAAPADEDDEMSGGPSISGPTPR